MTATPTAPAVPTAGAQPPAPAHSPARRRVPGPRALLTLPLVLAGLLLPGLGAPAQAADTGVLGLPLTVTDARGDWQEGASSTLTRRQKASIDLRKMRVVALPQRSRVRFVMTLRRVTRSDAFDQVLQLRVTPRQGSAWSAGFDLGVQDREVFAFFDEGTTSRSCTPRLGVDRSAGRLTVNVPERCVPDRPGRVRLASFTTLWRSDAPAYSSDRLHVPGLVDLR
ncbi:hypothetical protein [Nocardioides bruguierae]|uniref:Uncharacterized protein n=1 Tax=Nocardioides bruguierae TaxID=2945102 RepID=A0A9X2D7B2_9ACTN|nr:hypothetical protein [Nocardioides bruguierae]MCM0620506.1 hypothetical protein [Nocardioides bruguierae]